MTTLAALGQQRHRLHDVRLRILVEGQECDVAGCSLRGHLRAASRSQPRRHEAERLQLSNEPTHQAGQGQAIRRGDLDQLPPCGPVPVGGSNDAVDRRMAGTLGISCSRTVTGTPRLHLLVSCKNDAATIGFSFPDCAHERLQKVR